jgi:hypothetical protein
MGLYRLISLSDDGGAAEVRGAEFAADRDALDAASSLLNKHVGVEIWNGTRFVGLLPQGGAPVAPPDTDASSFASELSELFHETWELAEEIDDPQVRSRLFEIASELLTLRSDRSPSWRTAEPPRYSSG